MKYKLFIKQASPTITKEINLNATKVAEFEYGGTIAVEDVLHLRSSDMVNDFEPAPVKVVEIEHDLGTNTIYLGVSTDVETYGEGEDENGEKFTITVPSIGQLIDKKAEKKKSDKPEIVMLLGSSRYYDEILKIEKLLTLKGKIVLKHSPFEKSDHIALTRKDFDAISKVAKAKIRMADTIYVVGSDYIGRSTSEIIEYVNSIGKRVEDISREGTKIREISMRCVERTRVDREREGLSHDL